MDNHSTKPAIAVDVDGVLNLEVSAKRRKDLWYHHGWRRGRARIAVSTNGVPLIVNPEFGIWLQQLAKEADAELVWATRWNDYANSYVAPLANLPALPYVTTPLHYIPHPTKPDTKIWQPKAPSVLEWAAGRPLVWFDDEPAEFAEVESLLKPGQPFLGVLTDPDVGLTKEDIEKARAWLL